MKEMWMGIGFMVGAIILMGVILCLIVFVQDVSRHVSKDHNYVGQQIDHQINIDGKTMPNTEGEWKVVDDGKVSVTVKEEAKAIKD